MKTSIILFSLFILSFFFQRPSVKESHINYYPLEYKAQHQCAVVDMKIRELAYRSTLSKIQLDLVRNQILINELNKDWNKGFILNSTNDEFKTVSKN